VHTTAALLLLLLCGGGAQMGQAAPASSTFRAPDVFDGSSLDALPKAKQKGWTFLHYMDADNNLEWAELFDLEEMGINGMGAAGTLDEMHLVVLIDRGVEPELSIDKNHPGPGHRLVDTDAMIENVLDEQAHPKGTYVDWREDPDRRLAGCITDYFTGEPVSNVFKGTKILLRGETGNWIQLLDVGEIEKTAIPQGVASQKGSKN
jgi:hypothetical protein